MEKWPKERKKVAASAESARCAVVRKTRTSKEDERERARTRTARDVLLSSRRERIGRVRWLDFLRTDTLITARFQVIVTFVT